MTSIVKHTGIEGLGQGMSVLGEKQVRIPTDGNKIRSGIKVLTSAARSNAKAQPIYDAGVAAGKRWDVIEKELVAACNFERSPLTPKNVSYFTARPCDFIVPEIAQTIMQRYGSDGPDGFRLYRFPVIFPVDAWQAVLPHGLNCYTRSERVFWSEYSPDGVRHCMTHAPVAMDQKSKRAVRLFGGRAIVERESNGGICAPDKCPEYQAKKCNMTGSLIFYIPGIKTAAAIELPTTSFYSMDQVREKLEMVAFLRGGRISGVVDGQPIFFLSKNLCDVSRIDPETGKPKKEKQYLIKLEANIDMTLVFQQGEVRPMLQAGAAAAAALEPPEEIFDDHDEDVVGATPAQENVIPEDDKKSAIGLARRKVADLVAALKIPMDHWLNFAMWRFGNGWSVDMNGLTRAQTMLENASRDETVLRDITLWSPDEQ